VTDRTLVDGLARALRDASGTFETGREWPAALLWPDPERQWYPALPDLRRRLGARSVALLAYGAYAPDEGVGPAIWLRCLVEAPHGAAFPKGPLKGLPDANALTVILLPGVSWRALRESMTLDRGLQALVEMQYRGDVFRQRRQARDWTVATLLRDPDQGLGLDVATDSRTDEAARRALPGLLDLNLEAWRGRPVGADDFNKVMVADDARDVLLWISDPDVAQAGKKPGTWGAFRDIVKREYGVDVDEKGALQKSVERLIKQKSGWSKVWNRLAEAPVQFRPVCERIRAATPEGDLLQGLGESDPATNPHDNAIAEKMLEQDLSTLSSMSPSEASKKVVALEERHRGRRDTLWARLGEAPLACALEPLARLAAATEALVVGDTLAAIAAAYAEDGWRVDAALIETIAAAGTREELVARASGALYRPWVDALARRFRAALEAAGAAGRPAPLTVEPGTMVLFVDGLRMDVGHAVVERLIELGAPATLAWRLAPVPTVTATAKPLVTPVANAIHGAGKANDFLPLDASSGKPATTDVLRKTMLARGIQVLDKDVTSPPEKATSIGYAECGNLDHDGHALQLRLAGQVATEVGRVVDRALALRAAGWAKLRIVTDHGWLLMPGGFTSVKLPSSVTETNWSRAAVLSPGAAPELPWLPWYWDASVRIAMPPGAEAFRAGDVYSHGGLSPQECVTPDISVGGLGTTAAATGAKIVSVTWRRLRLIVDLAGDLSGYSVEVRRAPRDGASRLGEPATIDGSHAKYTMSDEIDEEEKVHVVLLDRHGSVADAKATAVGERA
jgi:hypothetical protein